MVTCPDCDGRKVIAKPDQLNYEEIPCPRCEGRGMIGPPCKECESEHTIKYGIKTTKKDGDKQRYLCRDCGSSFYHNPEEK